MSFSYNKIILKISHDLEMQYIFLDIGGAFFPVEKVLINKGYFLNWKKLKTRVAFRKILLSLMF